MEEFGGTGDVGGWREWWGSGEGWGGGCERWRNWGEEFDRISCLRSRGIERRI